MANRIIKAWKYYVSQSIIKSKYQTKSWRQLQSWYKNGKSNECEKYQIRTLSLLTNHTFHKTNMRLNIFTYEMINKNAINNSADGYELTETFDSIILVNRKKLYFNFKFVCDSGGAQTRSLREVYHFIHAQCEYLLKSNKTNEYFINVLDGDCSYKARNKFNYLLNKDCYSSIKKYVFIGDSFELFSKKKDWLM